MLFAVPQNCIPPPARLPRARNRTVLAPSNPYPQPMKPQTRLSRKLPALALALLCAGFLDSAAPAQTTLWRIGKNDGSYAEFTLSGGTMPAGYTIGANWATQSTWPEWPSHVTSSPAATTINYTLSSVPVNGVTFTFKAVTATREIPELGVYSNFFPCGIIQIGGAKSPGFGPPQQYARTFTRAYQIYIPAEFLVAGANQLQLFRLGTTYNRTGTNATIFLDFWIDYMQLDTLAAPPTEPTHGKNTYVGYSDGGFAINPSTIAVAQAEAEWMGIAYSNNPERVTFWNDLTGQQSAADKLSYLQKLASLNMTVILDAWNCANTTDSMIVNGQLPSNAQSYISSTFSSYGSYARFYEICNEPCEGITKASHQYCVAVANYVNGIRPSTLILAAPGYAFGGGAGDPVNWDNGVNDANRQGLDALCGAYNGHAFGNSYGLDNGSLCENVDAHGTFVGGNPQVTNGWDKPFITTECGSNINNSDDYTQGIPTNRTHSSILDRDLRANISFADYLCAADMWNNGTDYDYISGTSTDTSTWTAAPANSGSGDTDTRVKTLRRLALAYGTHGTPLHYTWQNLGTNFPLVYFRGVDTSTLPPLPGSGATSNKILLSFVNFDALNSNTIAVTVSMPKPGTYSGVYYDSSTTYTAARHTVSGLVATPTLAFNVTLGPGESVEYILNPVTATSYRYEAESLEVLGYLSQAGGTARRLGTDANLSNNDGMILDSNTVNDYVAFLLPAVAAGTYDVRVGLKKNNSRGIFQLSAQRADGTTGSSNIGGAIDEYATGPVYTEVDLGNWTPASTSDKAFKFTVTGKNAASGGTSFNYSIAVDYITLSPR